MTTCTPASLAELSKCLQQAHHDRRPLRIVGHDTSSATAVAHADLSVSLSALRIPLEHVPGDLIATLPAGLTLSAANSELMRAGQWLPLDPPNADRLTIGALIAKNACGPRRHRFGTPRDLIIGIELALADGRLVKAGGRVVKNVAGYDLARLMCGSFGSLAIITSATFKLSPLPAASRTIVIDATNAQSLAETLRLITTSPFTPTAVELATPPHRLAVRFESTSAAVEHQASALASMCEGAATGLSALTGTEEQALWDNYAQGLFLSRAMVAGIAVLPSRVVATVERILELAAATGVDVRIGGQAALGVLHARIDGPAGSVSALLEKIRSFVSTEGGTVSLRSPKDPADWGDMGDSWPLMQALKTQFDPHHLLNPRGGPGGL